MSDAAWLVIAYRLTEGGNPLGEFLLLTLKYRDAEPPESKKRRLRKLKREWKALHPWAELESWKHNEPLTGPGRFDCWRSDRSAEITAAASRRPCRRGPQVGASLRA